MRESTIRPRTTKYCRAIALYLHAAGHASNAQILDYLRREFPDLSATTVHRATTRLVQRGELAYAPAAPDGSMRFDNNIHPHDHFMCTVCGQLRDTTIGTAIKPQLENALGEDCEISGNLTIGGICKQCKGVNK